VPGFSPRLLSPAACYHVAAAHFIGAVSRDQSRLSFATEVKMSRRLKCFVASAFDRDDVDAIFDKAICPVLKAVNCDPKRVDRVEHNDDIDNKIFELMDSCDFCIADLTHARPSVYYEAGYIFGTRRPVIYVVRSDHFKHLEQDTAGNLRIHFDLQMKNIIGWAEANDTFRRKLSSRVRHIVRPLQVAMAKKEKDDSLVLAFAGKSQSAQLGSIVETGRKILLSRWFKDYSDSYDPLDQAFFCCRWHGTKLRLANIFSRASFTKKEMNDLLRRGYWGERSHDLERAKSVESLTVFASLASINARTLTAAFPASDPVSPKAVMKTSTRKNGSRFKSTIVAIDGVRSIDDFSERFTAACDQVGFTRKN
jgi:nucleoside 2-deoxyribosyltransferase